MEQQLAFVTGASGFIGGHAARRLADEGWRVRVLLRDQGRSTVMDLSRPGIEVVSGDLLDARTVRSALTGVTAVVHAAGRTRAAARASVWRAGVTGTQILHHAACERGVRNFIFISSFAVYSALLDNGYDENAALTPCGDAYADAKIAAERGLLSAVVGPRAVVLRPPAVYGPGSWYWSVRLLRAAQTGRLILPGGGQFPIVYTFVDNLVDAVVAAIARNAAGVFNVFDGSMPYADFVRPYAEMAGSRGRLLPLWIVRALASAAGASTRAAGWWIPFSRTSIDFLVDGHRRAAQTAARARAELGWIPLADYGEGINRTQRWFAEHGYLR